MPLSSTSQHVTPPLISPIIISSLAREVKKRVQLRVEECPDALKHEMKQLRTFYERLLNPLRRGAAHAPATLNKIKERALCFLLLLQER